MRPFPRAVVAAALLAVALPSAAQFHRDRGGSRDENAGPRRDAQKQAPIPSDPFSALERELPSLTVDLRLRPAELEAWNAVQRDVRAAAEIHREQYRQLLALRAQDAPAMTGNDLIARLADDARRRADVLSDLRAHLQALYDRLDERQRVMLDRRLVQSQTEPLGR